MSSAIRCRGRTECALRCVRHPGGPGGFLAIVRREHPLPEPDGLRRHLDQLVLLDVLQRVLEGDLAGRLEDDELEELEDFDEDEELR